MGKMEFLNGIKWIFFFFFKDGFEREDKFQVNIGE